MTHSWRMAAAVMVLAIGGSALLAEEPKPCLPALCSQLKSRCVCAPYCKKTEPCAPCYAVTVTCAEYCKKVAPACESYCFEWCTSIYCKKSEPCFPGDPCERQVWHTPCEPACASACMLDLNAPLETAMLGKRIAY